MRQAESFRLPIGPGSVMALTECPTMPLYVELAHVDTWLLCFHFSIFQPRGMEDMSRELFMEWWKYYNECRAVINQTTLLTCDF